LKIEDKIKVSQLWAMLRYGYDISGFEGEEIADVLILYHHL
jgi:hypothetical protein